MRIAKASLLYYALVFVAGFVLGTLRVLVVVPFLGVRWAELIEQPIMLLVSFYAARLTVRRFGPFAAIWRLIVGLVALVLMVATELGLTVFVQGQDLAQYVAGRDPASGVAYILSLAAFGLMPLFVGLGQGSNNSFKPKPLRGSA
jgi:hypothetical protein